MLSRGLTTIAVAALLVTAGCAGVRSAARSTFNTDMTSRQAPALAGTAWVLPASDTGSSAPDLSGKWALVKFFDPG